MPLNAANKTIIGNLIFAVLIGALLSPQVMKAERLELKRPQLEWKQVVLTNGASMWGVDQADYIRLTQYIVGLEYEYQQCHAEQP